MTNLYVNFIPSIMKKSKSLPPNSYGEAITTNNVMVFGSGTSRKQ